MKLKGLSVRELKSLENRLENEIINGKKNVVAQQIQLKKLRNAVGQVRARQRQLEYKDRLRHDFNNLHIE